MERSRRRAGTTRAAALILRALLLVLLATVGLATPAGAHGAEGRLEILELAPIEPGRVRIEVGVAYTNDGDPAPDATVAAVFTGPAGIVGPLPVPHLRAGLYGGELDVSGPGPWQVAFTAVDPAATAQGSFTPAPPEPTTTSTAPAVTTTSPTSAPGAPSAATDTSGPTGVAGAPTPSSPDDASSTSPLVWVAAGLVVFVVVAPFAQLARRNRPVADEAPPR